MFLKLKIGLSWQVYCFSTSRSGFSILPLEGAKEHVIFTISIISSLISCITCIFDLTVEFIYFFIIAFGNLLIYCTYFLFLFEAIQLESIYIQGCWPDSGHITEKNPTQQ